MQYERNISILFWAEIIINFNNNNPMWKVDDVYIYLEQTRLVLMYATHTIKSRSTSDDAHKWYMKRFSWHFAAPSHCKKTYIVQSTNTHLSYTQNRLRLCLSILYLCPQFIREITKNCNDHLIPSPRQHTFQSSALIQNASWSFEWP